MYSNQEPSRYIGIYNQELDYQKHLKKLL